MGMIHNHIDFNGDPSVIELLRRDLHEAEKERERLKSTIETFQAKLDIIVKNVSDIVYMLDRNSLITSINNGVSRFGFSPTELIGINIFEIVHPDDREKAVYHVNERRTGERSTKACSVRFIAKPDAPIDQKDMSGRYSLLTITAEGQYGWEVGDSLSFVGTLGIAREKDGCCSLDDANRRRLIPVCANCKSIRDEAGKWHRMESYLSARFGIHFTHSICPVCTKQLYPEYDGNHTAQ